MKTSAKDVIAVAIKLPLRATIVDGLGSAETFAKNGHCAKTVKSMVELDHQKKCITLKDRRSHLI